MQNSPPEFRPNLEGRLFTAYDANVDSNYDVHPTARLLYDSLPQDYREVFKNCRMYLEKQLDFVKFLKYMSETDVTKVDVDSEQLRPLGIQIQTGEGDKRKWQCGVVGCDFKDTLQHLYTHLQQKKHINLPMFSCQHCHKPFNRNHDRNRHEVKMHPDDSNAQTSLLRSKRGISHHNQQPKGRTRAGKNSNKPERRPPAYNDAVHNEDVSTSSDALSSSEWDDQLSASAHSCSPPNSDFDAFHQADTNKPSPQDFSQSFDPEGAFQLNQEPFGQISAVTVPPVAAGPTPESAQLLGYANAPQSVMGGRYNLAPTGRPPAQSQMFFANPTQQNTRPAASSSNSLMLTAPYHGNGFQMAMPPVTPVQPTNHGGMKAHIINNTYHIHSPPNPAQFTGYNPQTQPTPTQWLASMGFKPVANPQAYDYLQAPTPPQIAMHGRPSVDASLAGYYYHGPPTNAHDLQKYSGPFVYSNGGYGTSVRVPCTSMSSGPVRPLVTPLGQMHNNAHDKPPNESAMSPPRQQNVSNYGERLAIGYRISISGLKNYISPNASCALPRYSGVVGEKGSTTMINRQSPPAIYRVRGIKLFIMCCLVAMLLSIGFLLHPEWRLGGFTL